MDEQRLMRLVNWLIDHADRDDLLDWSKNYLIRYYLDNQESFECEAKLLDELELK